MIRLSRIETFFLVGVVLLSAILRLWNFVPHLEFLDDQGRDAIVAKRILKNGDLTLLGPGTSVGTMYLGPAYYYFMVPFLALTYPSPVGPALAVAILGIVTVALTFLLGKNIFGPYVAGMGAVLLAVAPPAVQLSRFSWQPNPAPLVGLLLFYATWQVMNNKYRWWGVVGICFALLLQLHYVALVTLAPVGLVWLTTMWVMRKKSGMLRKHLTFTVLAAGIVLLSFAPLVAFDLRHDGQIRKGFVNFYQQQGEQTASSPGIQTVIQTIQGRGLFSLAEMWGFSPSEKTLNSFVLFLLWFSVCICLWKRRGREQESKKVLFLISWVGFCLLGTSLYKGSFYYHYLGFVFPILALFVSFAVSWWARAPIVKMILILGLIFWAVWIGKDFSFWKSKTPSIDQFEQIANQALQVLPENARYNVTLLNNNREYKANKYRYFLEVSKNPPQSQYDYVDLDYLVVLVENEESPLGSPIYEVQQFVRENQERPALMTEFKLEGIVKGYVFARNGK